MNKNYKKLLAAFVAPISILGLSFSLATGSAVAAGETQQGNSGTQSMAAQSTTISTAVRPWCGWSALTGANSAIALVPVAGQETVYDGSAIALAATGQQFAVKVGPVETDSSTRTTITAEPDETNCSWYDNTQKNGMSIKTTLSGYQFDGSASADDEDTSMDFGASGANKFSISNTPVTCLQNSSGATPVTTGFDFTGSPLEVIDATTATNGANVVAMTAANTSTVSFCSWTSGYSISIPADLKPTVGGTTYTFVGPTITNTMTYSRS